MTFIRSVVLSAFAAAVFITLLPAPLQAQPYAWKWQQVGGPWTGQVLRTDTPNCHVTGEVCRCNNVCGASRPFGGEILYHANGCANPPLRLRCVNMGGPVQLPAAPLTQGAQGRSIEPPSTGPGCPRQGTRSPQTNARAKVTFLNSNAGGTLSVNWVDLNGNWVHYGNIARGGQYVVDSFVGHTWVILNANGRCIGAPVVSPGQPTFAY